MFSRILVPLDGSELSERAVPHAIRMARDFHSQLIFLQVLEPEKTGGRGLIDPLSWQIRKAETHLYLQTLAKNAREQHPQVEHHILEGKTPEAIVQFAHDNAIDLIVMSSHGQGGLSRWNLSSVVQKVLYRVYLPVLVVRAYQPVPEIDAPLSYKKILIPIDCSKRAECALSVAIATAEANRANIILLTVLRRPEIPFASAHSAELNRLSDEFIALNRKAVEEYLHDLKSRIPVETEIQIVESPSVSVVIHELAEEQEVDLVIFCAHGSSGKVGWPYGTVAENYIAHGSRPVLILQDIPPSLVSPTRAEIAAEQSGSRG